MLNPAEKYYGLVSVGCHVFASRRLANQACIAASPTAYPSARAL
jgi:hypothetical protein